MKYNRLDEFYVDGEVWDGEAVSKIDDSFETLNDEMNHVAEIKENLTVQLGDNGSVGGYKTGDVIEAGTSLQDILNKILKKAIPATYNLPVISLISQEVTGSSYEYGTSITVQMKAEFTQNDAGALVQMGITKNGVLIKSGKENPLNSSQESYQLVESITYSAYAEYEDGIIKNNNLGESSPEGSIKAGMITSDSKKITPYRQGYFYGVLDTDSSVPLTSAIIRSAQKKNGGYSAGNLPLIKASSVANRKRIFVACPAEKTGVTKVIMPSAVNADCTANFVKQVDTITVEGANGSSGIPYNIWVYEPAEISDDQTFTVTLG